MKRPFHLAFVVHDLKKAVAFYEGVLGCRIGRRDDRWVDFELFGHQVTAHLRDHPSSVSATSNPGAPLRLRLALGRVALPLRSAGRPRRAPVPRAPNPL